MKIERKTIFLYPNTEELDIKQFENTNSLITSLEKIVYISNSYIESLLCSGCFAFIKCKPSVDMKCIGQTIEEYSDYSNVRICVVSYNGIDYSSSYTNVIEEVKNGKSDISHLVGLSINSKNKKLRFFKDDSNSFDALIESNLDQLEKLLAAVMMDITLYHYFLLPNEISFRKTFNSKKFDYIVYNYQEDELKRIYGDCLNKEDKIYLPFSMKYTIHCRNNV